ncbi:MAG: protein kinase [Planctomycetota bacterium]
MSTPEDEEFDRTIPAQGRAPAPEPTPGPASPTGAPEIPGVVLGREIARGGMGVVYRGEQKYLARRVAVKVLATYLDGDEFVQRFQREARILAGIAHPHIVACHDAGTTDQGQCYLVMEFVDGPTLRAHCKDNGPLPLDQALRVVRDIAGALQHAHEAGVIHRDVKPENVLLQRDERRAEFPFVPKLVDLGLARQAMVDQQMTAPGVVMGTTSTMAPEQFDDPDRVDFRADIYGLGCVAHYALCGRAAFGDGNLTKLMAAKAQRLGPDLRAHDPNIPAEVAELVMRMLAHAPADRPGSYAEVIDVCVRVLGSTGERGTVATPRPAPAPAPAPAAARRGVVPALLLAVAVGGLGAAAAFWLPVGGGATPQPVDDEVQAPTADPTPTDPGRSTQPADRDGAGQPEDGQPEDGQPEDGQPEDGPPETSQPADNDGDSPAPPTDDPTRDEPAPTEDTPAPVVVPAFAADLAALGWRTARPEGMRAAAFTFNADDDTLVANCPDGEARCSRPLPAGTTLVGTIELKPGWNRTAAQRAAGVRVLPVGAEPLVVWLAQDGDTIQASLGLDGADGAWPPTRLDQEPVAIGPANRSAAAQVTVDHRDGELRVCIGPALDDPAAPCLRRALSFHGDCRVELFVRDGTAWFAKFAQVR